MQPCCDYRVLIHVSCLGPPVEIIQDYRERVNVTTKHEELEEDKAFAMVIEDAGIGASPIPEGGTA